MQVTLPALVSEQKPRDLKVHYLALALHSCDAPF